MKTNKKIVIVGVTILVIAMGIGAVWLIRDIGNGEAESEDDIYVESVAAIAGLNASGINQRYSGEVESQEILKIELPSDKKVDEIFVSVGDEVSVGERLFTYDLADLQQSLDQANLDMDRLTSDIDQAKQEIETTKKEKASASADAQLQYTTRISTLELNIRKHEFSQKAKQVEINQLGEAIQNTDVISDIDGIIKSVNRSGNNDDDMDMGGNDNDAFMSIMKVGDYRVKGQVNEQNASAIVEGSSVIVRSRVDDTIWRGTLSALDTDNPVKAENDYYMDNSSGGSTNYPFYVNLDSADGLMMGQHVYIEMDYGQEDGKDGLWLESYYIVQEGSETFVWAANDKDRLEKRMVVLGEYDEGLDKYEITDGLTAEDYIAFPEEELLVGMSVERGISEGGEEFGDFAFDDDGMDMSDDIGADDMGMGDDLGLDDYDMGDDIEINDFDMGDDLEINDSNMDEVEEEE